MTCTLLYDIFLHKGAVRFTYDDRFVKGLIKSVNRKRQTVRLVGHSAAFECEHIIGLKIDEDSHQSPFTEVIDVYYYKAMEPNSAGCELSILTTESGMWHNLQLNDEKTEGTEQNCGQVWALDKDWLALAMTRKGKRTRKPGGARKGDVGQDGNGGFSDLAELLSPVPLCPDLLAEGKLCVPFAFVNAVLSLLGEKPSSTPAHLPQDVFDNLIDEYEYWFEGYHLEKKAAGIKVPQSQKKLLLHEYQAFLNHRWGQNALHWGNAPEDGSYDQIVKAELVKKGYSGNWSRQELHDTLLAKKAVFILEVKNGHYVAIDTVADPPLIFETDARFSKAILFSEASLGALGCPQGKCLEVREVRLKFKSGKCLPALPSQGNMAGGNTTDDDDEDTEMEDIGASSDSDDSDYSGSSDTNNDGSGTKGGESDDTEAPKTAPKKQEGEAEAEAEAEAKAKADEEAKTKADAEAKAKADAEANAKADAEAKAKADAEAMAKAEADATAQAKKKAKNKRKRDAKKAKKAEAKRQKVKATAEVSLREIGESQMQELHRVILNGTDETIVDYLARHFGRFWAVPDPSTARGECYMYDERDCLWKSYHRSTFHDFLRVYFTPQCNAYKARINDHPREFLKASPVVKANATDEDDEEKKMVVAINKTLRTIKSTRAKNAYQKGFFVHERVIDTSFERKLNATPHYLSVRNGLIDLRDGSLIPRRYDHYISQCLDLDYDPDMSPTANAPWCKFVRDIFDAPELEGGAEVVAFLQSWLGFCLTGHGAQTCCIAVGSGANGKSLLQNAMAAVLRTVTASRYIDNWSSKIFNEAANCESSNQATPELAKLEGVRLAVINETGASQSWGESWKKLVDDTAELSVRQLHCKPKIIRNTAKWLINTNHMPEVPTDDCYVRRMMILPMLMRFVDAPDSSDPHQRLKNTELLEALVGTEEARRGVLRWMVEGAMGYYKRERNVLSSPPCCRRYKDEYVTSNEWTTLFVCGKENGLTKADHMSYNDIKAAIRGLIDRRVPTNEIKKKLEELGAQEKKILVQTYESQGFDHPTPPKQRKQMVCFIRLAHGDDSDDE